MDFCGQVKLKDKNSIGRIHRLPKIVINKKNFVFKDAIEQIRKDKRYKGSESRRTHMKSIRAREVLSEEARESKNVFKEDILSNKDKATLMITNKAQAKKGFKQFTKKLKKRVSDPIRLNFEENNHDTLTNFTKFNSRWLNNLK